MIMNFIGQGYSSTITLLFVPYYVNYLGIEAFGIIAMFTLLQGWFVLLDAGMAPTLSREMARFSAGTHTSTSIRSLLRSIELIGCGIALIVIFSTFLLAPYLANNWLQIEKIDLNAVIFSVSVMGAVIGLRFFENFYRSSLIGLQQQFLINAILIAISSVRIFGALLVLKYVSPTIVYFFVWQLFVSLISAFVLGFFTYNVLPANKIETRFDIEALKKVWNFGSGVLGITVVSTFLMQTDKIILSKILSLSEYALYALLSTAAGALFTVATPISQAWFPKLSQQVAMNDEAGLVETFHDGARLIAIIVGTITFCLIFFTDTILGLWLGDSVEFKGMITTFRILLLGNFLNCLMWIPFQTQLAHGWTSLSFRMNLISVIFSGPLFIFVTPILGPLGAAIVWACINAINLCITSVFMFNRILKHERKRWFLDDIAKPLSLIGLPFLLVHIFWYR